METNTSLKLGIVGYGKMGQSIAQQLRKRNHTVAYTVDPINPDASYTSLEELGDAVAAVDAVIEFSTPTAVYNNAVIYASHEISAVVGSTGWEAERHSIQQVVEGKNMCYLYGGNFSIGAHIFMRASQFAARLLNKIPDYDVMIAESHHIQKKDRPSGTALMTADMVLDKLDRKKHIAIDLPQDSPVDSSSLAVVSQRVGHEIGIHELICDSEYDTIKISHRARSRMGFAAGAIYAAEWICFHKHTTPILGFRTVHDFIEQWLL